MQIGKVLGDGDCWTLSSWKCEKVLQGPRMNEYILNYQVILSMDLFFFIPMFQGDIARIHRLPQSPVFNPLENLWDVLERALRFGPNLPPSKQSW